MRSISKNISKTIGRPFSFMVHKGKNNQTNHFTGVLRSQTNQITRSAPSSKTSSSYTSLPFCSSRLSSRFFTPSAMDQSKCSTENSKISGKFQEISEKKPKSSSSASFPSLSKGLLCMSAMPLVVAAVDEPVVAWTHMFGHAGSPYAEFLGFFPLGMFFLLQMSPMQTIKNVQKTKSVGNMSPLPYITLGTNCIIWTAYGILNMDPTIALANGMGVLLSGYYTSVYAKYTTQSMNKYYIGTASVVAVSTVGSMLLPFMGICSANDYLGVMGNAMAISFFASPLAVMQTVIKEKSTAAMPFAVTISTILNCTAWSAYGLLVAHDPYVIFPNIIGFGLAMGQLSLFVRFGISKAIPKSPVSKV